MSETVIQVENFSKLYRLGEVEELVVWPPQTYPRPILLPRPAILDFR